MMGDIGLQTVSISRMHHIPRKRFRRPIPGDLEFPHTRFSCSLHFLQYMFFLRHPFSLIFQISSFISLGMSMWVDYCVLLFIISIYFKNGCCNFIVILQNFLSSTLLLHGVLFLHREKHDVW